MLTHSLFLVLLLAQAPSVADVQNAEETMKWRENREKELLADQGWLSVSGLPWLKEGETSVGSGEGRSIRLADGPESWGVIFRGGGAVELRPAGGAARAITTEDPPFLIGRTWIQLIKRSDLVGLRLWDPKNARKLAFRGLEWYYIDPRYRVLGRLIPSVEPKTVRIANVIGQVNDFVSPGVVEFERRGTRYQLTPVYETPARTELFYIFKDETAAKTTAIRN